MRLLALIACAVMLGAAAPSQPPPHEAAEKPPGREKADAGQGASPQQPSPGTSAGQGGPRGKAYYEDANLQVQRQIADYTSQSVKLTDQAVKLTRVAITLTAVEAALFLVSTAVAVIATVAAWRSNKIAEEALAQTERPHLALSVVELTGLKPDAGDGHVRFRYKIQNYGQGLAFLTRTSLFIATPEADALPAKANAAAHPLTHWPVPPGHQHGTVKKEGEPVELSPENRQAVLDGNRKAYVVGVIEYKDAGGRRHSHAFAYRYVRADDGTERCVPWGGDLGYWDYT